VTSGLGGVYPAGSRSGRCSASFARPRDGRARISSGQRSARPMCPNVIVLLPKKTHDPSLDRVWRSTISADSAARRIAAAGDSLARRAAADSMRSVEAAAARLAGDSAARATPRTDTTSRPGAARPPAPPSAQPPAPRPAPVRGDTGRPPASRRPDGANGARP
jgi:rod shape-determining protein MreC